MKRNNLILSLLVLVLSMFIGGRTVYAADDVTEYYLPVFETSDPHGSLADVTGSDPLYLLAYISDKVWDVRGYGAGSRKDLAVLLDGGDIYDKCRSCPERNGRWIREV